MTIFRKRDAGPIIRHPSGGLAANDLCCCAALEPPGTCFFCSNQPNNGSLIFRMGGFTDKDCTIECRCARPLGGPAQGCEHFLRYIQIHDICSVMNRSYTLVRETGTCCWSLLLGNLTCANPGLKVSFSDACVADFDTNFCTKNNYTTPNTDSDTIEIYLSKIRVCLSTSGNQASGTVSFGVNLLFDSFYYVNGFCTDVRTTCFGTPVTNIFGQITSYFVNSNCIPAGNFTGSGTYANFCAGNEICTNPLGVNPPLQFTNCYPNPNTSHGLEMCLRRNI